MRYIELPRPVSFFRIRFLTLRLRTGFGVMLLLLLNLFALSGSVSAASNEDFNHKDKLDTRFSLLGMKAAQSLLVDAVEINGKLIAVGERGHILISSDNGHTWKQAKVPTQNLITAVYFSSSEQGWAVGHEAVVLHTSDGGDNGVVQFGAPLIPAVQNSSLQEPTEDETYDEYAIDRSGSPLLDVWFKNDKEGFAVGAYGYFLHTSDGGETWEDWSARIGNLDGWHLNAVNSADGTVIYVAGEKGVLFRSKDGGKTWSSLNSPYEGSFFGIIIGFKPNELLLYGLQGHIFKTVDGGISWREIATDNNNGLMAGVLYGDKGVVIVGNGGVIMLSKDFGDSFTKEVTDDRSSIVGVIKTATDQLLFVGQKGIRLVTPKKSLLGVD